MNTRNSITTLLIAMAGLGVLSCTTTAVPEASSSRLPDELATTDHVQTYGVIEDDLEAYPWTGQRYEDNRFAVELDNSPTSATQDYKPLFSEPRQKMPLKMTKASKKSSLTKAKRRKK
jgi:hypothetical protein